MYQLAASEEVQISRKRRYASNFRGVGIVRLPTNVKWDPKYLSLQNLPNACGEANCWNSSYSDADGPASCLKCRKTFGADFIKSNPELWSETEAFKTRYSSLLRVQDQQICFNQNDGFDEKQTALNCLAMTPIFGNWTLELWKKFTKECIEKTERDISKFYFLPAITAKAAFAFSAYNGLDTICSTLWPILRTEDRLDISQSSDRQLIEFIPSESLQEGPPAKRPRRIIDAANDFVNIFEVAGTSNLMNTDRSSPMPCVFATMQEENNESSLLIIPQDQLELSTEESEFESDSDNDEIVKIFRRRGYYGGQGD